jgi:predicted nucleic acid-binding protein
MRIYVDTSVVGGFYDKEFDEATKALFKKVEKGEIILVVSELLDAELLRAPGMFATIWTSIPRNKFNGLN